MFGIAFAQIDPSDVQNGIVTLNGLTGVFSGILGTLLGLAGILAFLMLIWGGFQFMTAGGDPKKVEAARTTLTYAILGVAAVALSYLVLLLISNVTNARSILNFRIFIP